MNKFSKILFLLFLITSINLIYSSESLAIVTKSIGEVSYKKYSETIVSPNLNLGSELFNEDLITTKSSGFVKFSYLDDGTTIKIHKNSEVYVSGDVTQSNIDKQINISNGVFNFDISKQDNKEFTIITPTSVASVKGTKFILSTTSSGTDEFYGFEGIVEVLNKESNTTLRLSRNVKVTSSPTGEITSEIMTQQDYSVTNQIIETEENYDSQEFIPDGTQDEENNQGTGTQESPTGTFPDESVEQEVRIKIKNENGDTKELIIRYNE